MSRNSIFGWSLPPGCTHSMIEDAMGHEGPCQGCGEAVDDCICPECPKCHEFGNPKCYIDNPDIGYEEYPGHHGLRFTTQQLIGQTQQHIRDLKEQIHDAENYIEWLMEDAEGRKHR